LDVGTAVAKDMNMNTNTNSNIKTICQIFAQKQGGSIVPLNSRSENKTHGNGIKTIDQTDKSSHISRNRTDKNDESRFDDTLRKQMSTEVSDKPDVRKGKKQENLEIKETAEGAQNQSSQSDINIVRPGKLENAIRYTNIKVDGLTETDAVPQDKKVVSLADRASQNLSENAPIKMDSETLVAQTDVSVPSEVKITTPDAHPILPGQNQSATQPSVNPDIPVQNDTELTSEPKTDPMQDAIIAEKTRNLPKSEQNYPSQGVLPFNNKVNQDSLKTSFVSQQEAPAVKEDIPTKAQTAQLTTNSESQGDISKGQAFIHRMNVSMEQIESIKTEKQYQIEEKADVKADVNIDKQLSTEIGISQAVSEKSPVTVRQAEIISSEGSKLNVGQQIQESVKTSYNQGIQQIVIRLDPPDLGRVTIRFTEQRDGITGMLYVDKPDTKYEIQQALPSILQNLQNSDIQIRKMDVVLNNQHQQQDHAAGDFTTPNENFQHENSSGQNSSETDLSYDPRSSHKDAFNTTNSDMEFSDKSINMLI